MCLSVVFTPWACFHMTAPPKATLMSSAPKGARLKQAQETLLFGKCEQLKALGVGKNKWAVLWTPIWKCQTTDVRDGRTQVGSPKQP